MNKANIVKEKREADNFFSQNLENNKKKSKIATVEVSEDEGYSSHEPKEKEAVWFIDKEPPKDNVREIFVRPPKDDDYGEGVITSAS